MSDFHCKEHDTDFFKTPKMKGYAHPIKDADGEPVLNEKGKQKWCNMADALPPAQEPGTMAAQPTAQKAPAPTSKPDAMSKDEWRDKDRAQRQSIERQVSIKCACEIASTDEPIEQILETAGKIAKWIAQG